MNNLLKDEIAWVNSNPQLYYSTLHQKAVIGNITKRYEINKLKAELAASKL